MASPRMSQTENPPCVCHCGRCQIRQFARRTRVYTHQGSGKLSYVADNNRTWRAVKNSYKKKRTGMSISDILNMPIINAAEANDDNMELEQADDQFTGQNTRHAGIDDDKDEVMSTWDTQFQLELQEIDYANSPQKTDNENHPSDTAMPNDAVSITNSTVVPVSSRSAAFPTKDITHLQTILREAKLVYHEVIGLCACLDCLKVLFSNKVIYHLRTVHKQPAATIQKIEKIIPFLPGIISNHSATQPWPDTVIPALEGILVEQGFHCQFCHAAFRSDNAMKTHLRTIHPKGHQEWRGRKLPIGPMQSLSSTGTGEKGWRGRAFQVIMVEGASVKMACMPGPGLTKAMDREAEEVKKLLAERDAKWQAEATVSARDPTAVDPWLMKMEWIRFLGEVPLIEWYRVSATERLRNEIPSILRRATRDILYQALRTTATLTRLNRTKLNNPQDENHGRAKVLRSVQTKTSNRYFDIWANYILFVLDTTKDMDTTEKYKTPLTQQQRLFIENIRSSLQNIHQIESTEPQPAMTKRKNVNGSSEKDLEDQRLEQSILDFSYLSLDAEVLDDPFQTPLVAYTAACAVVKHHGSDQIDTYVLARPHQHTSLLAAIRFCARVIVAEKSDRLCRATYPNDKEQYLRTRMNEIQQCCDRFMMTISPSPMGEIQSRLSYAFSVSYLDRLEDNVCWLNDNSLKVSAGIVEFPVLKDAIRWYIRDTQDFLLENLLFTERAYGLPSRDAMNRIKDDLTTLEAGYWFGKSDQKSLNPTFDVVRQSLMKKPNILQEYVYRSKHGEEEVLEWTSAGQEIYELNAEKFVDRLMVLIHLTYGSPARGREFTSIRWRNTPQQVRNIQIVNGEVVIRTQYHKSLNLMSKSRFISRVLAHAVGRMVVAYLSWVIPFRDFLHARRGSIPEKQSCFLWSKGFHPASRDSVDEPNAPMPIIEHHFSGERLSERLRRWTRENLKGVQLGMRIHRHVTIAIGWKKIQDPLKKIKTAETELLLLALGILDEDGEDREDGRTKQETDEAEILVNSIFDQQCCHTSDMAEDHYARGARVWSAPSLRNLEIFRRASRAWHALYELDEIDAVVGPTDDTDQLRLDLPVRGFSDTQKGSGVSLFPSAYPFTTTPEVKQLMSKLLHTTVPKFKSIDQARCYFAMEATRKQRESVILVMATGAGKTLPILLSAQAKDSNTTVVITPFVALMDDFQKRCSEAGVECERWEPNIGGRPTIIVVAAETMANSQKFSDDLKRWTRPDKKLVDRIVLDEAQILISAFYRNINALADVLPAIQCQKVFLTATLPPTAVPLLLARCGLASITMVRAPTSRKNLCYRTIPIDKSHIEDGVYLDLISSVMVKSKEISPDEKIAVFTRTKQETRLIAELLACEYYNGDLPSDQKKKVLTHWRDQDAYKVIVATFGGLGIGIDLPKIRYTYHHGRPTDIMTAAQEFGRAGRDERPSTCFVFYENSIKAIRHSASLAKAFKDTAVKAELVQPRQRLGEANAVALEALFDEDKCIRTALTEFLDDGAMDCTVVGGERCSRCDPDKMSSTQAKLPLRDENYLPPLWSGRGRGYQITLTQMQRNIYDQMENNYLSMSPPPDTDPNIYESTSTDPLEDTYDQDPKAQSEDQWDNSEDTNNSHTIGIDPKNPLYSIDAFPTAKFSPVPDAPTRNWTMTDKPLDIPGTPLEISDADLKELFGITQLTAEEERYQSMELELTGLAANRPISQAPGISYPTTQNSFASSIGFATLPPTPQARRRSDRTSFTGPITTTCREYLPTSSAVYSQNSGTMSSSPWIQVPRSTARSSSGEVVPSILECREGATSRMECVPSSSPASITATARSRLFQQWTSLVTPLVNYCVLCRALGRSKTHTWAQKREAEHKGECDTTLSFGEFLTWKRLLLPPNRSAGFPPGSCCYKCYLPYDLCRQMSDGLSCGALMSTCDIVLPVVMLPISIESLRPTQEEIRHPLAEKEFMNWLRQGHNEMGIKTNNCFMYFIAIAKKLSQEHVML